MDEPNARKVHKKPVPKVGGMAFAFGALVPVLFLHNYMPMNKPIWTIMIGAWIIVLFGVLDDIKELGYRAKFFGQLLAAVIVVYFGDISITGLGALLPEGIILPPFVAIPLTVITIIGVTNAINLADGLDGLAGGISLLTFLCIGYLAYMTERPCTALISVAMVGGLFGFLRFNTYPATVFMGDAGSQLIGFLAITLSLWLTQGSTPFSHMLPLLLVGFPVLDTLTVMAGRKLRGRPLFKADKNHFHHKLMNIGLYHTEAVFLIYIIQTVLVTFAFLFRFYSEWLHLAFYLSFMLPIFAAVLWANNRELRFERPGLFDRIIKERLKFFKQEKTPIKVFFGIIQVLLPVMLFFNIFMPVQVPYYISASAFILAVIVIISVRYFKAWSGNVLRCALYITIPYLIYISEKGLPAWAEGRVMSYYNIASVILALFAALTIKFTKRSRGFKATPMDFIILFIAVIVPNLPDFSIQSYNMGLLATKIIVMFFAFEVWICESRGELKRQNYITVAALLTLAVRGLL